MDFADAVRIDDNVIAKLDALVPLAPLHQPHNLTAIRAVRPPRPTCCRWRASTPRSTPGTIRWPS
jgi:acetate kinase